MIAKASTRSDFPRRVSPSLVREQEMVACAALSSRCEKSESACARARIWGAGRSPFRLWVIDSLARLPIVHHIFHRSPAMTDPNVPVTKHTMLRRIEREQGDRPVPLAGAVREALRADPHIYKVRIHLDGFVPRSYNAPSPGELRIWTKDEDGKWREKRREYDRKTTCGRGHDVETWTRRRAAPARYFLLYNSRGRVYTLEAEPKGHPLLTPAWCGYSFTPDPKRDRGDSAEKAAAQRVMKQVLGAGLNLKGQTRDAGVRQL